MASLTVYWPSEDQAMKKDVGVLLTVGRAGDCDITIDDESISSKHACIRKSGNQYLVVDTHSTNGVYVNDQRVEERVLQDGDRLRFDDIAALFELSEVEKAVQVPGASPGEASVEPAGPAQVTSKPGIDISTAPVGRGAILVDSDRQQIYVRTLSSIAVAGGILGPALLGVGWLLGIAMGLIVLTSYREEADRQDRVMALWGVVSGAVWLVAMGWFAQVRWGIF